MRDLEEGYTQQVAFVIPPGAVWPLPLYELALMTARQVASMGIADVSLTVITPEAVPLALFGPAAAAALREELTEAGIELVTATMARVERGAELEIVLQPSTRRLGVQRIVALPGVEGPAIPGTKHDDAGFIRVGESGQMLGSSAVWAAGDAIAYPIKYGGLSTQQADVAAAAIAARTGADVPTPERPALHGVLMTGAAPRALGPAAAAGAPARTPLWRPTGKVYGTYLTPFITGRDGEPSPPPAGGEGVTVDEPLPAPPEHEAEQPFHALWSPEQGSGDYLARLGHEIHEYERHHEQAGRLLREQGQLRRD